MISDAKTFLALLLKGGSIVSSNDCSEGEIAMARACHRFHVDENHFGYVYRSAAAQPDEHVPEGTQIA